MIKVRIIFCQSLIRIIFSKEKHVYFEEIKKIKENEEKKSKNEENLIRKNGSFSKPKFNIFDEKFDKNLKEDVKNEMKDLKEVSEICKSSVHIKNKHKVNNHSVDLREKHFNNENFEISYSISDKIKFFENSMKKTDQVQINKSKLNKKEEKVINDHSNVLIGNQSTKFEINPNKIVFNNDNTNELKSNIDVKDFDSDFDNKCKEKKISDGSEKPSYSFVMEDLYLNPNSLNKFEVTFIKNICTKCIKYYYDKFGNKHKLLFRRDEAYDDIIKVIFMMYGSSLLSKIYSKLKELTKLDLNNFDQFYKYSLTIIISETPIIILLVLKYIYENVNTLYNLKTYEPLMTMLFFNFLFNPKFEEYNDIDCTSELINEVNKLVNKICFNSFFNNGDSMCKYNPYISNYNKLAEETIEKLLEKVNMNEIKLQTLLENSIYKNGIELPSWLFYFDCDFILRLFDEGKYLKLNKNTNTSKHFTNLKEKVSMLV